MLTFKFQKHSKHNLSVTALEILSKMIQDRARHFVEVLENKESTSFINWQEKEEI